MNIILDIGNSFIYNLVIYMYFLRLFNFFVNQILYLFAFEINILMGQVKQRQLTCRQILSHPHFKHLILYGFSYLLYSQSSACLGPMLPYLAAQQGRIQTDYSLLFVTKAAGFIIGSILARIIGQKFTLHQFISFGIILMGVGCILFGQFQSINIKAFCIFIVSIGCSFKQIQINVAALYCFKGENLSSWLQIIHGCFGIGGLIGPISVYIFELRTLTFLGSFGLITLLFYYTLQNPQKNIEQNKIEQQDIKKLQLPTYSLYLVLAGFFFAVGQTMTFGSWISSSAVRWNFSTKQHATFYSSLYWFSITFFRFFMVMVPGSASNKIKWLAFIAILNSFVSYFIIFNIHHQIGLIFMSFVYGLCNSIMFTLLFTIPGQFGYQVTVKQSSIFIIWCQIGAGCLSVGVGKIMQWLSYDWLIYSMGIFNIILVFIVIQNTNFLQNSKTKRIQNVKLQSQITSQRRTIEQFIGDGPLSSNRIQQMGIKQIYK